jgi:hypothetical protein
MSNKSRQAVGLGGDSKVPQVHQQALGRQLHLQIPLPIQATNLSISSKLPLKQIVPAALLVEHLAKQPQPLQDFSEKGPGLEQLERGV